MISPGAPLLSPRGKVLEHGMPRFFRRLAEGVFDEDDVRVRAHELADFVEAARQEYGLAAARRGRLLQRRQHRRCAAAAAAGRACRRHSAARHGAAAVAGAATGALAGKPVLIVSGARDPIAPPANAARLKATLEQAGAQVDHRILSGGHELSRDDVELARTQLAHVPEQSEPVFGEGHA